MQVDISAFFDAYWRVVCAKVRRPLSGVLLPDDVVVDEATLVFEEFLAEFDSLPSSGEIGTFLTGRALRRGLEATACARAREDDPQRFYNPEEQFYDRNLDLVSLQQRSGDGRFESTEWGGLPSVLKGRAVAVLRRCGVPDGAIDDVFVDCLAALAIVREKDGIAPIEQLTIFEEVVPLFTTMVHNRGVSWLRKQSAQKNRPNNPAYGESLDDPDKFITPASDQAGGGGPFDGLTFDAMYESCCDCLSELEWHILTALFVEANVTRGDLANDSVVMKMMQVKASSSLGNRRRHLNKHLESALEKLGDCLKTRDF
ncbi:MAG: hypothetical protein ACI8XO_000868 [Verrucomicrobiales bacterium]